MSPVAAQDAVALLADWNEVVWQHGDDLCDCTFQQIGLWTNPYIAETLQVRFCCIWSRLFEQFPDLVQRTPAAYDPNTETFTTQEPADWDSADDAMPRPIWYRQLAKREGLDLPEVRRRYRYHETPRAVR
jgi:hypothetical protein